MRMTYSILSGTMWRLRQFEADISKSDFSASFPCSRLMMSVNVGLAAGAFGKVIFCFYVIYLIFPALIKKCTWQKLKMERRIVHLRLSWTISFNLITWRYHEYIYNNKRKGQVNYCKILFMMYQMKAAAILRRIN